MPRAKKKQAELDRRNSTFKIVDYPMCINCKHWWNNPGYSLNGSCQPQHLEYRDSVDHFKETPANGTCDIWEAKEDA